jgi:hypothetical protein
MEASVVGFLVAWLVNSTIVAVVAGFKSGDISLGQWVIAGGGGLVLSYLEVRLLETLSRRRNPMIGPGPGASERYAGSGFVSDRFGFRFEVTPVAVELGAWRPFGRSQKAVIPLSDVDRVLVKWTGLVSVLTKAGQEYQAGLGDRAQTAAEAIQEAAAAAGSKVTTCLSGQLSTPQHVALRLRDRPASPQLVIKPVDPSS